MTSPDELDADERSAVCIDDHPLDHIGEAADPPAEVGRPVDDEEPTA